jgi:hypothetical protein
MNTSSLCLFVFIMPRDIFSPALFLAMSSETTRLLQGLSMLFCQVSRHAQWHIRLLQGLSLLFSCQVSRHAQWHMRLLQRLSSSLFYHLSFTGLHKTNIMALLFCTTFSTVLHARHVTLDSPPAIHLHLLHFEFAKLKLQ